MERTITTLNCSRQPLSDMVLMVPPEGFSFNPETAASNAYQQNVPNDNVTSLALTEFDGMVTKLRAHGINVLILKQDNTLPDAVFPNNWFSTHLSADGKTNLIIYPMLTPNRRAEVNVPGLMNTLTQAGMTLGDIIDLSQSNDIVEGTGSLVFDHAAQTVFATISDRTNQLMVNQIAHTLNYEPVIFHALDHLNKPIYHTNVMMGIANDFAIVCLDCIPDSQERNNVQRHLTQAGKQMITITREQIRQMCGNVLAVMNNNQQQILLTSSRARQSFTIEQTLAIESHCQLLDFDITTIETIGGGSVRCMLAEIFYR